METIKKGIPYFNWSKAFENLSSDEKVEYHNEALLNIFRSYSPNKKIECDYCQPPWILTLWINKNIKSFLKPRSKLTKTFYKSGLRKNDHINVLEESTEKKVLKLKNYVLKMTAKLEGSNNSPKTYWEILNRTL